MLTVYASLLPVFLLIGAGFGLRKSGVIPAGHWRGIELICYWVLFPALLISVMADSTLSLGEAAPFALSLLVMVCIMCVLVLVARRPLQKWIGIDGPAFTTFFQTTVRWHSFIALAIVGNLYGDPGLAVLAVAFAAMIPPINIACIVVLATYVEGKPAPLRLVLGTLVRNPLIWGVTIGLILQVSETALPDIAASTLQLAGDGALGVSLLALGAGLSWKAARTAGAEVALASIVKLLFVPMLAAAIALAFGVHGMAFVIAIVAAGVPTAVNGYVLARTMGGDAELYAATATAQVVVSFATLPFLIWMAMRWVG